MKTLAERIADALLFFGFVQRPALIEVTQPPAVVVQPQARRVDFSQAAAVRDGETYDGDDEFVQAAKPQFVPFDLTSDRDPDGKPYEVSATLYEASTDGRSYRLQRYEGRAALLEAMSRASALAVPLNPYKLREAAAVTREQVIEDAARRLEARLGLREAFDGGYADENQSQAWSTRDRYGDGRDANAEYIPLMGGPYSKQLYLYQYLDMHRKAFEAYNHNPVAHQLIELTTAFVLGRGVDHQATNNEVDEIWREFVDRTNFYQDLENIANDLWWQGELMMEFYDDEPRKGFTDYRMIDPSTVWEIVTDPEDIQKVFYYHQQYSTPYQQYVDKGIQMMKYIIRQIPADDVLHVKLNVSKYEKRGRSDLFSVLGWVKRLKDLMNARVIKGQLEAAFVYDIEINAGDAQVAQANLALPDPFKPGSMWVHNKNAQMKAVQSGIKANESQPDIAALLNLIAVGFGIPKEFIGEMSRGGAKGGILAATEPGTKRFERRQRVIEFICQSVADRVIQNAIDAGRLDIDKVLEEARSVMRLGKLDADMPNRSELADEMEDKNEEFAQKQEDQMQQQQQFTNKVTMLQLKQQHELALNDQKNQHRQNLAANKSNTSHTITRITRNESAQEALRNVSKKKSDSNSKLSDDQKERMETIKKSGKFAKEFLEFIFPSIAQEDRSAKMKDLALAEAMQWLPKSWAAKMAAQELNITTYSFKEAWSQIVEEAELGLSMAKVYVQENQHTPATTIAQDVQAEQAAKQPIAPQNTFTNVPVPPTPAGDKLVPSQPKGAPGSVPPGQISHTGDTKVNEHSGPQKLDPTAKPHGFSAQAKNPFTPAGAKDAREAMRQAIADQLLREAIGPATELRTQIAQVILANAKSLNEIIQEMGDAS